MKITVGKILESTPDAYQGLTKTEFATDDFERVYMFSKPENVPSEGTELDGTIEPDRQGKQKFTKTKQPFGGTPSGTKEFKADPVKQESIEWQACLKASVDTIRDWHQQYGNDPVTLPEYKRDVIECLVTYTQAIQKKPTKHSADYVGQEPF